MTNLFHNARLNRTKGTSTTVVLCGLFLGLMLHVPMLRAAQKLGTGNASLLGGDLTDPEDAVKEKEGVNYGHDKSEDELYRETEAICRATPGFKPIEEWRAEISRKISAQLEV